MTKPGTMSVRANWTAALVSILLGVTVFFCAFVFTAPSTDAAKLPVYKSCKDVTVKKVDGQWVTVRTQDGARVNYTGVARNDYGWWKTTAGKVDWDYNGVVKNDYGWWRIANGRVDFGANGLYQNEYGWWKVENGKVNFGFTGFADNEYGKYYVSGGKVDFNFGGLVPDGTGHWYYAEKGKVRPSYDGLVVNNYGAWYVKNGEAQFGFDGAVNGYNVQGGKVIGPAAEA